MAGENAQNSLECLRNFGDSKIAVYSGAIASNQQSLTVTHGGTFWGGIDGSHIISVVGVRSIVMAVMGSL